MSIRAELIGDEALSRALDELTPRETSNRVRRALRAALAPVRDELRRRGRAPGFPRKFRSTRTRQHRNPVGISIAPASPLSPIFEHGAKAHQIEPSATPFLADEATGFFARGAVQHPGMRARPISGPAFDATRSRMEEEFMRVLMEGL